jgi:hypothetical protein
MTPKAGSHRDREAETVPGERPERRRLDRADRPGEWRDTLGVTARVVVAWPGRSERSFGEALRVVDERQASGS